MNRRDFFKYSTATVATSAMAAACQAPSQRLRIPPLKVRQNEKLLLQNVQLVDVEKKSIRKESSLLIENGRIIIPPAGNQYEVGYDKSINMQGAFVSPGMMNAHAHLTLPCGLSNRAGALFSYERQVERNAEECIKHGVTTVRDMLQVADLLTKLKEKIARNKVNGPRIVTCCAIGVSGGYGDSMAIMPDKRHLKIADTPDESRDAVKAAHDNGADLIKIFQQPRTLFVKSHKLNQMNVDSISAITDEANKKGMVVALHQTETDGFHRGIDGGATCFEHVTRDRKLTEKEILKFKKLGVMNVPTLSASFGLSNKKRGDKSWLNESVQKVMKLRRRILHKTIVEQLESEFVETTMIFLRNYENPNSYEQRHLVPWPDPINFTPVYSIGMANTKALYDAGIELGLGNDGGVPFAFPGAIDIEMRLLRIMGIKQDEILKMATINNARLMKLDNDLGSIETGKIADLVVFNKNPLEKARNVSNPLAVFKEGKLVFRSQKASWIS